MSMQSFHRKPSPGQDAKQGTFPSIEVLRAALSKEGFATFSAASLIDFMDLRSAWCDLVESARSLPRDPYCQDGNRFRRFGELVLMPNIGIFDRSEIRWDPILEEWTAAYSQAPIYNPEEPGTKRWFAALSPAQLRNASLQQLIRFDFATISNRPEFDVLAVRVGIHLIKLIATPDRPAGVSPGRLHRDGELATHVHLLEWSSVDGGETVVASPGCVKQHPTDVDEEDIYSAFRLERPLASYAVIDEMVAHHLEPIRCQVGSSCGVRTAMLIDFTPLRPDYS